MGLVLEFIPAAAAEFECVTGDYEARASALGSRFRKEVESVCTAMVQHPFLWRLRPEGFRRVDLPGFPYYVAFVIEAETVYVVAVAHANRNPDYFAERILS